MCNNCGCKYEEEDGTCSATGSVLDDTWPKDSACELAYESLIKEEAEGQYDE
jgi:hypothetical protein